MEGDGSVALLPGDVPLDEGVASLQLQEAGDVPGDREQEHRHYVHPARKGAEPEI